MKPADLGARISEARRAYATCTFCERRCGVDRTTTTSGFCGLGTELHVARVATSAGEEEDLSPAVLVYLGGCSMRCAFCLSGGMVDAPLAAPVANLDALATDITKRLDAGARCVEFLGGDPSVNVLGVLELVQRLPAGTRIAWNTNLLHTASLLPLVEGVVDTWLPDFKFGNDACARRLAATDGYVDVVRRNLAQLLERKQRVVVRHVVMPGHVECCTRPVAGMLAADSGGVEVNFSAAFVPLHRAWRHPELVAGPGFDGAAIARDVVIERGLRQVAVGVRAEERGSVRGYAGTVFVGADGRMTVMDPAPGLLRVFGG